MHRIALVVLLTIGLLFSALSSLAGISVPMAAPISSLPARSAPAHPPMALQQLRTAMEQMDLTLEQRAKINAIVTDGR